MYSNKDNVNILTSLLVSYGITHVVVCPGSRNAPLVHNFNECPSLICHPVTDERSAGFIALGLRIQTKEQVAICVTSGSALLNVLPAAAEATYQHQGIIVISADRPAEWIDQLDGQTLPQPGALGKFVSKSISIPEPHTMSEVWYCKRLVCEAIMDNMIAPYPSVHINVPISEPLFDFSTPELPEISSIVPCLWNDDTAKEFVIELLSKAKRPMIIMGQMPNDGLMQFEMYKLRKSFVVLSEQLSSLEQTFTDQILYALQNEEDTNDVQPDLVMFIGGHTISKRLRQFMRNLPKETDVIMVTEDRQLHDISQHTSLLLHGDALTIITDINKHFKEKPINKEYNALWQSMEDFIRHKHECFMPEYSQMLAVKLFEKEIDPVNDEVFYANSMSVRLAALYADHYCNCNRGLNGIEGSLSVAVGASLAKTLLNKETGSDDFVFCVIGDLSFFYDENALWQQQLTGNLRILLLNNSQGGIFRNLKGLEKSPVRDSLVSAHHNTSAEGICKQFNVVYLKATDEKSLQEGIKKLYNTKSERPVLLEVITDINEDERVFKDYYHKII